ncbi:MAG TPA: hypothetical protein VFO52_01410 [Longimicrobiales bacterium]|nr:hypothetical protein [Longimicrobiales bacterium]
MTWRARLIRMFALLLALPLSARAQTPDPLGWNAPRALELVERARVRRDLPRGDSTLANYTAKANGFVYFYLDRQETDERTLVKVDQVALELFWRSPDRTKQRIVGLRDVSRLPNKMYYHLDHLTVVQNGFGDVIKIGDGDEVRDVPHPAAAGADTIYDYRLADSVTLQLGGQQEQVRVYQVQVRPKRTDRSALIGSIFVDRATADIVRMTFTFTPVSYVDRRLDYINISLDNGLFAGRYWLPAEQSVEIRRQIPELDFAAGAVIKGRLRVGSYEFNQQIADSMFWGRPVSALPEAQRRAFPFPDSIYAGINDEGLAPAPRMEELQQLAAELVGESKLSGLPPWRLYMPDASSYVRYNRAEGWYAGMGASYVASPALRLDALGGYAFGAEHIAGSAQLRADRGNTRFYLAVAANTLRDIGPVEGMPGILNTISGRLFHDDYMDPYYVDAVGLRLKHDLTPRWQLQLDASAEDHSTSLLTQDSAEFRVVLPIDEGRAYHITAGLQRALPETSGLRWAGGLDLDAVNFENEWFLRPRLQLQAQYDSYDRATSFNTTLRASTPITGPVPRQYQALIGGRNTVPGWEYRAYGGDTYGLLTIDLSRALWEPWLRLRAFGGVGFTDMRGDSTFAGLRPTTDLIAGGGLGVSLFWDILRFDLARGDEWRVIFSVQPGLRDIL